MQFNARVNIGLIGEMDVRRELAVEGWVTINTNTEKGNFPNVDIIAAKNEKARMVQVKTTNAEYGSHKHCLNLGRGEAWLTKKVPFFNSKNGPLKASVVVLVHAKRTGSRFVILPVCLAEKLASICVEQWYKIQKRNGQQRSAGFNASPPFTRLRKNAPPADEFMMKTMQAFENRWEVFDAEVDDLNNLTCWGISLPNDVA